MKLIMVKIFIMTMKYRVSILSLDTVLIADIEHQSNNIKFLSLSRLIKIKKILYCRKFNLDGINFFKNFFDFHLLK